MKDMIAGWVWVFVAVNIIFGVIAFWAWVLG